MTSKASSAKGACLNLYGWTLRKNALIIAIGAALSLIVRPGLLLAEWADSPVDMIGYSHLYYSVIGNGQILFTLLICVLILLLFGINFRYLHEKTQSDLFHALPISRVKLLLTRFGATLTGLLIPTLLSGGAETVVAWQMNSTEISVSGCLFTLCMQVTLILAAAGMVLLFCVLTGNTFDMMVSLLVVNVGWVLIYALTNHLCNTYLFGYYSGWNGSILYLFSPFARLILLFGDQTWSVQFDSWSEISSMLSAILFWLFYAAVMLGLSVFLIKRRKNETAGKPYAYTAVRYLMQGVATVLAGFLVGMLFSADDTDSPLFYIFMVVGVLLGAIIYGAIATRGFKTILKSLITAGVCAAVLTGTILTVKFDLLGYGTRIPDKEDVKSVKLTLRQFDYDGEFYYGDIEFTSAEVIEGALELHQAVVNQHHGLDGDYSNITGGFTVEYQLPFGRTMRRDYNNIADKKAFWKIYTSEEFKNATDPLLVHEKDYGAEGFDFDTVTVSEYLDDSIGFSHTYSLDDCGIDYLTAHKMDLENRTVDTFNSEKLFDIELTGRHNLSFPVYRSDKATLRLLTKQQVVSYLDTNWTFRYHEDEHIITHQEIPDVYAVVEEDGFDYTPTVGADPLLDFEAQGGKITDYSHVEFEDIASPMPTNGIRRKIRSSTYGLQEKIAAAYKADLAAYGNEISENQGIYTVRFLKGAGVDSSTSPIVLTITPAHLSTLQVIVADGIIAQFKGEEFIDTRIM